MFSSISFNSCGYQEVQGPGNLNSGAGVVDVSVIPANRAVSPIRVACQCPHKVSQVHNRGRVLLPWVTAALSSPITFPPTWQWESKMSTFDGWSFSFVSLENLISCLFVCLFLWVRGRQTERGFSWALLNGKLPPLVFVHKEALLFWKRTIELFTETHTTLLLPWRMFTHTHTHRDPSQSQSQYVSPLSNTKVGYETMLLVPLLLTLSVLWSWRW